MLAVREWFSTSTVVLLDSTVTLPLSIQSEVEQLWQAEQRRCGKPLSNGRILSAVEISPLRIRGRVVEYRHLIAQRARPELFDVLRVRPVAVSGVLECADGIVLGRRAATMTQDAGLWELVPSGGIDTSSVPVGAEVDYRAQILTELHEEIGIDAEWVTSIRPFCLVDDLDSHVLDIGIAMESPLSAGAVLKLHREAATGEYDELRVVDRAEVGRFIQGEASQLVGVSAMLIQESVRTSV
jgi:hypothetical protein